MKLDKKCIISMVLAGVLLFFGIYLKISFEKAKEKRRMEELYTVKSTEDVNDFIKSLGYICDEILIYNKRLPFVFNEVYNEYNELQKAQGFDLTKYKGENVEIYKGVIKDSENGNYAVIIVRNNLIIGCSIHSDLNEGFIGALIDYT